MLLRRLRGFTVLGLLVASACATQTNGPLGTESEQGGASSSGGGADAGATTSQAGSHSGTPGTAGGTPGAVGGTGGALSALGGAGGSLVGNAGANAGGGASGSGTAGMKGVAGTSSGGTGGNGAAGAGKGGSGGSGVAGSGAAGSPSAGAGGGGSSCATPTTQTLNSIYDAELNAAMNTANAAYVAEANIVRDGTAGSHRAVFWFDLSTVPAGKTLKTAKLQLTIANNPGLSKTMAVHRISQAANRAWDETQVTWLSYKTGMNWTTAGGDFVAQASDTQAIADNTPAGTVLSFNVLSDAQSFYATPGTNYGWLLKDPLDSTNTSGEHVYIAMRENTTITPPKLVLTYCP